HRGGHSEVERRIANARTRPTRELEHEHSIGLGSPPSDNCRGKAIYRLKVEGTSVLNQSRVDTSYELPMYGMHHGLQPVMCTKFVVHVVKMVTKCLQTDTKCPRDFPRILAL